MNRRWLYSTAYVAAFLGTTVAVMAQSVNGWNLGAPYLSPTSRLILTTPPIAPSMPAATISDVIVWDGDSLTDEQNVAIDGGPGDGGTTDGFQSVVQDACEMLGSSVSCYSRGRGGYTCLQLLNTAGAWAYPLVQAGRRNIYVFQCGINDVAGMDAGTWGVSTIVARYQAIADAAHANGFQIVVLRGPESNAYFDARATQWSGVDYHALDAAAKALYPAHVDGYVQLNGDFVLGIADAGAGVSGCIANFGNVSWQNECFYLDALVHKTRNADVYEAQLTNRVISPLL